MAAPAAGLMSYVRGAVYIWASADQTHFWSARGEDGWRDSVWAAGEFPRPHDSNGTAGGVGIQQDVVDAFVLMRFAELLDASAHHAAIERAFETGGGNFGCAPLRRHADRIRQAFPIDKLSNENAGGAEAPRDVVSLEQLPSTRVVLAPQSRLDAVEHLAERFFREVVDFEYGECLVTDESDLRDFASANADRQAEVDAMLDRFVAHYLLDPKPIGSTNIVRMLEFLAEHGVAS